jgi:hypothetical protein
MPRPRLWLVSRYSNVSPKWPFDEQFNCKKRMAMDSAMLLELVHATLTE